MTQATRQHRLLVLARHRVINPIRHALLPVWELAATRALVALTGFTMVTSAVFGG